MEAVAKKEGKKEDVHSVMENHLSELGQAVGFSWDNFDCLRDISARAIGEKEKENDQPEAREKPLDTIASKLFYLTEELKISLKRTREEIERLDEFV